MLNSVFQGCFGIHDNYNKLILARVDLKTES